MPADQWKALGDLGVLAFAVPEAAGGLGGDRIEAALVGEALGRGATAAGTSTTTGDGGMTEEERGHSKTLVYQYLPSRYGMNPDDLRRADAIEVVVGQGAKPGGGGMLLMPPCSRAGGSAGTAAPGQPEPGHPCTPQRSSSA